MNFAKRLSYDRALYLVSGCVGVAIGVLDFTGLVDRFFSPDALLRMTLVAAGLLLVAVTTEAVRRDATAEALLAGPAITYLEMHDEVPKRFVQDLGAAEGFVNEAVLAWRSPGDQRGRDKYRNLRDARVSNRQLRLRQLVVVYHEQHLRELLCLVARFRASDRYELKYFEPLTYYASGGAPLPSMSMWSFGSSHSYLGSFEGSATTSTTALETMVCVRDAKMIEWLQEYWTVLWADAKLIKHGLQTDEAALQSIARHIGVSDEAFRDMKAEAERAANSGRWENARLVPST